MLRSVIICSHNRAVLLKRLLASLAGQTFHPERFEVVVVDDNSGDNTAQVCQMMRSELPNLKYIFTGRKVGSSEARNIGVKGSSGDLLLFTDDDCIPRTDWVEQLSTVLEREQIAAGAVATTEANYLKLCHNIAEFHAFMPGNKAGLIEFIAGANMAFRKKVLEDLGMFKRDQQYACDMEIILRARSRGYRIFFEPGALVTHDPDRIDLGQLFF
jgi:glycosyltransferase involved in cell wall biosynthesis